ncbi:MAG: hypothetical protein ABGY42_01240, partial [bacterium]
MSRIGSSSAASAPSERASAEVGSSQWASSKANSNGASAAAEASFLSSLVGVSTEDFEGIAAYLCPSAITSILFCLIMMVLAKHRSFYLLTGIVLVLVGL